MSVFDDRFIAYVCDNEPLTEIEMIRRMDCGLNDLRDILNWVRRQGQHARSRYCPPIDHNDGRIEVKSRESWDRAAFLRRKGLPLRWTDRGGADSPENRQSIHPNLDSARQLAAVSVVARTYPAAPITLCHYPRSSFLQDPFARLSDHELRALGLEIPERRIPFRPVTTDPAQPPRVAFVGLNAYCGEDYPVAYVQRNFTEWAQRNYKSTLFAIMSRYRDRLLPSYIAGAALYYTNFVKVVLPNNRRFVDGAAVKATLRRLPSFTETLREILHAEVGHLVTTGCRVFVGFGEIAAEYFRDTFGIGVQPSSGRVVNFTADPPEQTLYMVHEQHFSSRRLDLSAVDRRLEQLNARLRHDTALRDTN